MVRGEPIRMLLSHAGVKYEDKKISMEEWPSQKASMPNGQMPALELDDEHSTKLG
jgi:glutathione S-transferase